FLDQIVAEEDRPARVDDANDLAGFIRRVSAGHVAPRPSETARQQEGERFALAGDCLRALLRHPRFQAIEAAWRAAFMVVRGLGDGLEVYLLDLSLPELVANLDAVRRELARRGQWGCIAANYAFGQSETDARVLERLAGLAQAVKAPLL